VQKEISLHKVYTHRYSEAKFGTFFIGHPIYELSGGFRLIVEVSSTKRKTVIEG